MITLNDSSTQVSFSNWKLRILYLVEPSIRRLFCRLWIIWWAHTHSTMLVWLGFKSMQDLLISSPSNWDMPPRMVLYPLADPAIPWYSTHWAIPLPHSALPTELSHYPIVLYPLSYPTIPLFHYSTIPLSHYPTIPLSHYLRELYTLSYTTIS